MDGNRRFADRLHVGRHIGHSLGYDALLCTLKDCFDLHVKTVTLFAFSIDNFQRPHDEVSALMDLMQTKLEALIEKEGLASEYGIQVRILGDLSLLPYGARIAAEKAMAVTSNNNSAVLNLCISYTSTHEIVQSIQRTCGNVANALDGVDGSHGALDSGIVVMCNHKICGVPNNGNGNGHAVWSHMARCSIDRSNELLISHASNGDLCSPGQQSKWHGGEGTSDSVSVNAYHSIQDGLGVYDHFCNRAYAHATTSSNWCDADKVVNVNDCDFNICENHLSKTWDEWANNSEVSSKDVMGVESKFFFNNARSSQVVTCELADSTGLRNRTNKKAGILKSSVLHDLDSISMHDCDSNKSHRHGNHGCDARKAHNALRSAHGMTIGDLVCELACNSVIKGSEFVDCRACEVNKSQQCLSGSSNSNSSRRLECHSCQVQWKRSILDDLIRKSDNTIKEGFSSNCTCGKHCYLNDRILKVVKGYVSEEQIEKHLYTGSCSLPDLLIRTSGETRLSNFLLWQASFSHLAFCKVLWPEFSFRHLFFIILEYQRDYPSLLRKRQNKNIALFRH